MSLDYYPFIFTERKKSWLPRAKLRTPDPEFPWRQNSRFYLACMNVRKGLGLVKKHTKKTPLLILMSHAPLLLLVHYNLHTEIKAYSHWIYKIRSSWKDVHFEMFSFPLSKYGPSPTHAHWPTEFFANQNSRTNWNNCCVYLLSVQDHYEIRGEVCLQ